MSHCPGGRGRAQSMCNTVPEVVGSHPPHLQNKSCQALGTREPSLLRVPQSNCMAKGLSQIGTHLPNPPLGQLGGARRTQWGA